MNELETILVGLDWEYTRKVFVTRRGDTGFIVYTIDNQMYLAAYTQNEIDRLPAETFTDVSRDSAAAVALAYNASYIWSLFILPASSAVVSAAVLSAFPKLGEKDE